jgi:hypothetical protein
MASAGTNPHAPPPESAAPTRPAYPPGVPAKFSPDGAVQPFPGNTIIAHLPPTSPLSPHLQALHEALATHPLKHLYVLLPPASWHMTMLDGVCAHPSASTRWPSDLAPTAGLAACTASFARKLSAFDLACPPPYALRLAGHEPLTTGIALHVSPATAGEATRLRALRDRLAETLGLRRADDDDDNDHAAYSLHISMAYFLRHLDGAQEATLGALLDEHLARMPRGFELDAPEFCAFEDMFAFRRILHLTDRDAPAK